MAIEWKSINRWTSIYTTIKTTVGLLDIIIDHYPDDYKGTKAGHYVRVAGSSGVAHRKVNPYATMDEAKEAGYKLLRKEAQQMLKELDSIAS